MSQSHTQRKAELREKARDRQREHRARKAAAGAPPQPPAAVAAPSPARTLPVEHLNWTTDPDFRKLYDLLAQRPMAERMVYKAPYAALLTLQGETYVAARDQLRSAIELFD